MKDFFKYLFMLISQYLQQISNNIVKILVWILITRCMDEFVTRNIGFILTTEIVWGFIYVKKS
jgi:hypothetical protein